MKPHEYCIDILIACLVIFIAPILFFAQKKDTAMQLLVTESTNEFLKQVQTQGYITEQTFEEFVREISITGAIYDISLEHKQKIYEPEYVNGVFTGEIYEYYDIKYTEEIVSELYQEGEYFLDINDYFTVAVENKSKTIGMRFLNAIFRTSNSISTIKSGRIRDIKERSM